VRDAREAGRRGGSAPHPGDDPGPPARGRRSLHASQTHAKRLRMPVRETSARRERAREHARRDILVAAAEVFARRGYAAATLAELADAAGFAAPSLYRYFSSKEEIFRNLIEVVAAEVRATFEEAVDRALPLAARLEGLLRAQGRLADTWRSAFEILRNPGPDAPSAEDRPLGSGAGMAFYEKHLTDWLRRNASRTELRRPPELVARAIAGIALAFSCAGGGLDGAGRARIVIDLALNGVAVHQARRGANP
jgi:AcrR family transcriptional regulator